MVQLLLNRRRQPSLLRLLMAKGMIRIMLKKWLIAAGSSVVVCLAVTLWIVPQIKNSRAAAMPWPPLSSVTPSSAAPVVSAHAQSSSDAPESRAPVYLVGEYEGNVAAFRYGQDEPIQVLETPLSVLPEEDRRLLREGIPVETEAELAAILEDYS